MKAYIFPGQGSQFTGMCHDLFLKYDTVKPLFSKAEEILEFDISKIMFEGSKEDLTQTKVTQPAIFIHSMAILKVLGESFKPDLVAGHSLGEFSALVASGVLNYEDGLKLVSTRAKAMQKSCENTNGTMAAILALENNIIEEICEEIEGVVVADYFAISELQSRHKIVENLTDAGAIALRSGVDLELPDGVAYYQLKEKIETGKFDEAVVDQAVRRVLEMKMRANLFETPFADPEYAEKITGNQEARDLAVEAARKAAVLLKNENNILPLDRSKYNKIAIIGPNAAVTVLGGYSDEPRQTISILEGVENKVGKSIDVVHAKGVSLTNNNSWWDDEVSLIGPEQNRKDIVEAVKAAKGADLIILAIGGNESTSREAWSETHMGDRNDITLIGEQKELIEALAKTGKPIVSVIISGRPLSLSDVESNLDAILYGWILGQETGTAVADILFGDTNPSGKMPVSVPRSVGNIPAYYNHKPTARRGYAFADASPLYAFGEGMSYTAFDISEPILSSSIMGIDEETSVSVEITNTGMMAGEEVVQLYIRDKVSSVTRNVKDLKGFKRVSLAPGETKTVTLPIRKESLWFYNLDMERVVEPGEFDIMVGNSSQNVKSVTLTVQ